MAQLTVRPVQSQLHWHGQFAAPAFGALSDPNLAYAALYRAVQPYGATLDSIKVDFSNFPQAEVRCDFPDYGVVLRLGLERIELGFLKLMEFPDPSTLVDHIRQALVAANRAFEIVTEDLSLSAWAVVESGSTAAELLSSLVLVPADLQPANVTVRIVHRRRDSQWTILLEEAERYTTGLYYRLDGHYDQTGPPAEVLSRFKKDAVDVLASFGVHSS